MISGVSVSPRPPSPRLDWSTDFRPSAGLGRDLERKPLLSFPLSISLSLSLSLSLPLRRVVKDRRESRKILDVSLLRRRRERESALKKSGESSPI